MKNLWKAKGLLNLTEEDNHAFQLSFARIWWKLVLLCLLRKLNHWKNVFVKQCLRIHFADHHSLVVFFFFFFKSHLNYKAREEFIALLPVALSNP